MPENVENMVLEMLRGLRSEVKDMRSEMHNEFRDIKHRLSQLEGQSVRIQGGTVSVQEDVYRQQTVIDIITERLVRIERRLELQS